MFLSLLTSMDEDGSHLSLLQESFINPYLASYKPASQITLSLDGSIIIGLCFVLSTHFSKTVAMVKNGIDINELPYLPWKVHRQYSTLVLIDTGASIGTSLCYEHGYTGIRFFQLNAMISSQELMPPLCVVQGCSHKW